MSIPKTRTVIFSGAREWEDHLVVRTVLVGLRRRLGPKLIIVHGDCPSGLDAICKFECERAGITQDPHPADWDRHGRSAGPIRNREMLEVDPRPLFVMAFHNDINGRTPRGGKRGTKDMLDAAASAGIPGYLVTQWPNS